MVKEMFNLKGTTTRRDFNQKTNVKNEITITRLGHTFLKEL